MRSRPSPECFISPLRETNNETNSRNNENNFVRTMFLTMKKKKKRGRRRMDDITFQSSFKKKMRIQIPLNKPHMYTGEMRDKKI